MAKKKWLDHISVNSLCISSDTQSGILGTRSGGPVAAAYAVTRYLGVNGYEQVVKHCMKTTAYAKKQIKGIDLPLVLDDPPLNVLGVKLRHLDTIVEQLSHNGWKVNKMDHLSGQENRSFFSHPPGET